MIGKLSKKQKEQGMITIDLLKGRGIPPKSGLAGITLAVITMAAPVVLMIASAYLYMTSVIAISIGEKEVSKLESKIEKYSEAVALKKAMEREKSNYNIYLAELKPKVEQFTQWTPIIEMIAENMPDSVTLKQLKVWPGTVSKKVPKDDKPGQTKDVDIPVARMKITFADESQANNDKAIDDFRNFLLSCPLLESKLVTIEPSRTTDDGRGNIVNYTMECVLRVEI